MWVNNQSSGQSAAIIANSMIAITNKWDGSPRDDGREPPTINLDISPDEGDLIVEVDAPFYGDVAPTVAKGRCPHLWEFEAISLFLASSMEEDVTQTPYVEIIIGPHGHWLVIGFPGQGRWAESSDEIELDQQPEIKIDFEKGRWSATLLFNCALLPEPQCNPEEPLALKWLFNAYSMHGLPPDRGYHAHAPMPGAKPNFHQLKHFAPLVLHENDPYRHRLPSSALVNVVEQLQSRSSNDDRPPQDDVSSSSQTVKTSTQKGTLLGNSAYAISTIRTETWDGDDAEDEFGDAVSPLVDRFEHSTTPSSHATRRESLVEVAERLRATLTVTSVKEASAEDEPEAAAAESDALEEKYSRHLHEGEFAIVYGEVWKRKGWSHKKRMLILTSKPRILYVNAKGVYKGCIAWTLTTPIQAIKMSDSNFDIELFDQSRRYHFNDKLLGAERWITAVAQLSEAWERYLIEQTGAAPQRPTLKKSGSKIFFFGS